MILKFANIEEILVTMNTNLARCYGQPLLEASSM